MDVAAKAEAKAKAEAIRGPKHIASGDTVVLGGSRNFRAVHPLTLNFTEEQVQLAGPFFFVGVFY